MPIGTGIIYNVGDLILSQVSGSGTSFLETKIAAATSSIVYFDSTARINSASLNSITVGTASYVSGSRSIITNLTASNISASGTGSFGMVGIGTTSPAYRLNVVTPAVAGRQTLTAIDKTSQNFVTFTNPEYSTVSSMGLLLRVFPQSDARQGAGIIASGGSFNGDTDLDLFVSSGSLDSTTFSAVKINARGSVGIGTTSPSKNLHIRSTVAGDTGIIIENTNNAQNLDIDYWNNVGSIQGRFRYSEAAGDFYFYPNTAAGEALTIKYGGNVLIGTTTSTANGGLLQIGQVPNTTASSIGFNNEDNAVISAKYNLVFQIDNTNSVAGRSYEWNKGGKGYSDGTNLMTLNASGSLGIGTSSPVTKLDVVGLNGSFPTGSGTIQSTGSIVRLRNGDSNLVLDIGGNGGNGNWLQATNRSDLSVTYPLLLNPNGGNVGIGTTSPSYNLSISGSAGLQGNEEYLYFHSNYSVGNNARGKIRVVGAGGGSGYGGDLRFSTRKPTNVWNEDALTIDSSGNVGIGTSSPAVNLEVVGASETLGTIRISGGKVNVLAEGEINSALEFAQRDASVAGLVSGKIASISEFSNGAYAGLGFYTAQQSRVPELKEAVRIKYDGNVGIGTTVPAYLLDVSGSSRHGYRAADTHQFTGSVSVSGSVTAASFTGSLSGSITSALTASYLTPANSYTITNLTASNISASLTGSFGMVGIGTASPSAKLQIGTQTYAAAPDATYFVAGNDDFGGPGPVGAISGYPTAANRNQVTASIFDVVSGWEAVNGSHAILRASAYNVINSTPAFVVLCNGNVGIGTTSPGALLDVNGLFRFQQDIRVNNGTDKLILSATSTTTELHSAGTTGTIFKGAGNNEIVRFDATNFNVGIGTTTVSRKLHVYVDTGPVMRLQSSGSNASIEFIPSIGHNKYNWLIGAQQNISDAFEITPSTATNGTTFSTPAVLVKSDGNVGIGTTSPSGIFHAANIKTLGTTADNFHGYFSSVNRNCNVYILAKNTEGSYLYFGDDDSNTVGALVYEHSANYLRVDVNGSERMRIVSNGNVGIGTTSPTGSLQVNKSSQTLGATTPSGATIISNLAGGNGILELGVDTTNLAYIQSRNITDQTYYKLLLNPSGGSVGIGTSSPGALLEISSSTAASLLNVKGAGGNGILFVSGSGNVGIGTTTPGAKLDVVGDLRVKSAGAAITLDTSATSDGRMEYKYNGTRKALIGVDSDNLQISADSGNYLQFRTNGSQRMIINNAGGVGIGTSNPNYAFDVYTNGSADALMSIRASGSANARIYFDAANGDLTGGDYCHLGQDKSTLNFVINTGGSAGNIHLQPKEGTNNGILFVSGSTRFGLVSTQNHQFTGSVNISGSLNATASWAQNVVSASYALTSSFATRAQTANALNASNTYSIAGLTSAYVDVDGSSAPTTGIYRPSTKTLGLSADGTLIFKISNVSSPATSSIETGNFIVQTGNVGIGTTSVPTRLTSYVGSGAISGTNDAIRLQVASYNDAARNTIVWAQDSSNIVLARYGTEWNASTNQMNFVWRDMYNGGAGSTELMRFTGGGNLGIGTTVPVAKLEISGSSNSALMNIKSAISGAILYVSGSGAVGIGTSNVGAYTLQVSGSFAATTKSFVIEHPTKAGKKLIYGSLESPYHGIRLTGRDTLVNGKCKIQLPDYMYKLILHDSVNIQLTGIKCNKTLYVDEINIPENYFTIAYDKAIFESYKDYDFFWDFTAIRADVPELQTEM